MLTETIHSHSGAGLLEPIAYAFGHLIDPPPAINRKPAVIGEGPLSAPIPIYHDPRFIHIHGASATQALYDCGHLSSDHYVVMVYGDRTRILRYTDFPLCAGCAMPYFRTHTIFCCRCGQPIWPGMYVCAYDADSIPARGYDTFAVGDKLLACARYGCCSDSHSIAGEWTEAGFKPITLFSPNDEAEARKWQWTDSGLIPAEKHS